MNDFKFVTSTQEVKAEAFDIIARYVHETYDEVAISNITPDEAFFCTVVRATEQMLGDFRPAEEC